MNRKPGGDTTLTAQWDDVLDHRPAQTRDAVRDRFHDAGVLPETVREALRDGGDALHSTAKTGAQDWADGVGGPLAVALIAAEVGALAAHLNSRASVVRSLAVDALLDDFSAVTVAARLGVSRQKVYDIARAGTNPTVHLDRVPWRRL